ncbi:MAG: YihY/virulence factor BrkB family protein, partial [Clostridia bacterium]|nr:YihY/virulence factor BrkB family protein [Clostridia bacterium]
MERVKKQNPLVKGYQWGKRAIGTLSRNRYTTLAGTLVFFLILSIVPFLFWLTLLFGSAGVPTEVILELELFGWASDLLLFLKQNAEGATAGVSVLLLATTLWSSSSFFYHLRRSGEIIYGYNREKNGWKVRLSAFAVTFCVLLYFLVAGGVLIGAIIVSRYLRPWLAYPVTYLLVLVAGFFAAWILNGYICPYRAAPADTVLGSLFTAIAWLVASAAFSVYLKFVNTERLYGALSTVVVFLLWLYWRMICFTAGVIYNRYRMETKGMEHKKL